MKYLNDYRGRKGIGWFAGFRLSLRANEEDSHVRNKKNHKRDDVKKVQNYTTVIIDNSRSFYFFEYIYNCSALTNITKSLEKGCRDEKTAGWNSEF